MKFKKLVGLLAGVLLVSGVKLAHAQNSVSVGLNVNVLTTIEIAIVGSTWTAFSPVNLGDTNGVVSNTSVQIQNQSVGLNVFLRMAANDDQNWAVGSDTMTFNAPPAADQCIIRAMFNTTAPSTTTFANPIYQLVSHNFNGVTDVPTHSSLTGAQLAAYAAADLPTSSCSGTTPGYNANYPCILPYPNGFRDSGTVLNTSTFAGNQVGNPVVPTGSVNAWFEFIPASANSVVKTFGQRSLVVSVVAELD